MIADFLENCKQTLDKEKLSSAGFWFTYIEPESANGGLPASTLVQQTSSPIFGEETLVEEEAPPSIVEIETSAPTYNQPAINSVYNGRKKSLLIGINYRGAKNELDGCINDVKLMKELIMRRGWPDDKDSMFILTEEEGAIYPSKENILLYMNLFARNVQPGDDLFLHYSGHGVRVADKDGDEDDGFDEALCPVDYKEVGVITDDTINKHVIQPLPKGSRLTIIFDCCHSGTACDLPYVFKANDENMVKMRSVYIEPPTMIKSRAWEARVYTDAYKERTEMGKRVYQKYRRGDDQFDEECRFVKEGRKECLAEVIMFSGCDDDQTSADVSNTKLFDIECGPGGAGGACTNALAAIIEDGEELTYIEVLEKMRQTLKDKGFKQTACLSSSREIPMNAPFSLLS